LRKSHKQHEKYPGVHNEFAKEVTALVSVFDVLGMKIGIYITEYQLYPICAAVYCSSRQASQT